MLIKSKQELQLYIPTTTIDQVDKLSGFMRQAETSMIIPILGKELYKEVTDKYKELGNPPSSIVSDTGWDNLTTEQKAWAMLIRACQMPTVFRALYESASLFAVSVNSAGLNIATTDNYPEASKDSIAEFKKACYKKMHEGVEQLLLLLESDAKGEMDDELTTSLFSEKWQKSKYYYSRGKRIIRTATDFQQFVDIEDKREKFIQLIPDLTYCEDLFIYNEIGAPLIERVVNKMIDGTANEVEKKVYYTLQRALCFMVESRSSMFKRPDAKNDATLTLNIAIATIQQNGSDLMPEYESCPFYVATPPEKQTVERYTNSSDNHLFIIGNGI